MRLKETPASETNSPVLPVKKKNIHLKIQGFKGEHYLSICLSVYLLEKDFCGGLYNLGQRLPSCVELRSNERKVLNIYSL